MSHVVMKKIRHHVDKAMDPVRSGCGGSIMIWDFPGWSGPGHFFSFFLHQQKTTIPPFFFHTHILLYKVSNAPALLSEVPVKWGKKKETVSYKLVKILPEKRKLVYVPPGNFCPNDQRFLYPTTSTSTHQTFSRAFQAADA